MELLELRERPETPDSKDLLVLRVHEDLEDQTVLGEREETLVLQDHKVFQDHRANQDQQESREHQGRRAPLGSQALRGRGEAQANRGRVASRALPEPQDPQGPPDFRVVLVS